MGYPVHLHLLPLSNISGMVGDLLGQISLFTASGTGSVSSLVSLGIGLCASEFCKQPRLGVMGAWAAGRDAGQVGCSCKGLLGAQWFLMSGACSLGLACSTAVLVRL